MGLSNEEMLLLLDGFLRKSNYTQGQDGKVDMLIQYVRQLISTAERSYIQGTVDGYLFGVVKTCASKE